MYFVHTCIKWKPVTKEIYDKKKHDKLLEILKGSEKFVLAKFYSNVDKKI